MDEIVRKLEEAPASATPLGGPAGRSEPRYRVVAEWLGGQRKRAEVWGETADGTRRGSRWAMESDEGKAIGGDDTAPSPLAYFSAGLAL
jgi:hypothetical protein